MLVRVVGVDHVVLRTADPVASTSWYADTLGLTPMRVEAFRAGNAPFPSCRVTPSFIIDFFPVKDEAREGALPPASSDERRSTGFDHLCLEVDGDIEAVRRALADGGIAAEPQFDGVVVKRFGAQGDARSIYIRDPDGYVIELRSYGGGGQQQQEGPGPAAASAGDQQQPLSENKVAEGSGI